MLIRKLTIGVESGSQRILDSQNKGITLAQIEKAVKLCKEYNIKIKGSFIIGFKGETKKDIGETINLAEKLDLDIYSWHILQSHTNTLSLDWKQMDIDMPNRLLPETAEKMGHRVINIITERHTILKLKQILSGLPKHISGFTFQELHKLLELAIKRTKQNSEEEASCFF